MEECREYGLPALQKAACSSSLLSFSSLGYLMFLLQQHLRPGPAQTSTLCHRRESKSPQIIFPNIKIRPALRVPQSGPFMPVGNSGRAVPCADLTGGELKSAAEE